MTADECIRARTRKLAEKLSPALKKRFFEGYFAETAEEAKALALSMIPEGGTVAYGGSRSVDEIGLKDAVRNGGYRLIDRDNAKSEEEREDLYRQAFYADVFLASANALPEDGVIINIDGNNSRVAPIGFGPKSVILIVGRNKLARDVDDGYARAKYLASPVNAGRLNTATPCTVTGKCSMCTSPECICCSVVFTRFTRQPGRIKVILVNEDLGF